MKYFYIVLIFVVCFLASCSKGLNTSSYQIKELAGYKTVMVNFATDRLHLAGQYGGTFGRERTSPFKMSYGRCRITIPAIHKMGNIEEPRFWRSPDIKKHIIMQAVVGQDAESFFSSLSKEINKSNGKNALIFIHGYNVSFEEAAKRTAQMAYDLNFDGAPIFYSWPSQSNVLEYPTDEANIEWTQSHLNSFLQDFFLKTQAENVYIIAHSMGNRAMAKAINDVSSLVPGVKGKIKELILAAPDIDADIFKNDIAPALVKSCQRVTVYGSASDLAILSSKLFHTYRRLGDTFQGVSTVQGIELIDATGVDTSLLGINHSYMAGRTILTDIAYIIKQNLGADNRFGLKPIPATPVKYWKFAE